jgi:hypothetical protein
VDVVTDVELDKSAQLERRVRELEAENARLAAESDVAGAGTAAGRAPRRSGWWRALLSALCIVLAGALLPVSIVAAWSRAQLVDESQFVATLAPLAHDPQVQGLVIDQTVGAIDEKVNYDEITGNVIDGIAGLGLPPRAVSALGLLKQPAADGLRNLVHGGSRSSSNPTRSSTSGRALSGAPTAPSRLSRRRTGPEWWS